MRIAILLACLSAMPWIDPCFARAADAWDRNAVYAARVAELQKAIDANPSAAQPLVDLAAFYLKPLALRNVECIDGKVHLVMVPLRVEWRRDIKDVFAVGWVWRGDPDAAKPLLQQALKLDPKNTKAMREMAMVYRMYTDLDRMKPYMEAALAADPQDLDMCRLYLDHRTTLARVLNDQAVDLRTPRTWEEQRTDGVYRVTQQPSDADYARAKHLDAQAQDVRRQAILPLQNLAKVLKNDPNIESDPKKAAKWRLATAIYFEWIGENEKAAGTSAAALRYDPTYLDAMDYLMDMLRGTRTTDKLATYKAVMDKWVNGDSTPVIAKEKPRGPRR